MQYGQQKVGSHYLFLPTLTNNSTKEIIKKMKVIICAHVIVTNQKETKKN